MNTNNSKKLLYPVRFHLAGCALLSALGAAAGLAPYLAVAEISRFMLLQPHSLAARDTVWFWVYIGCSGACLRLLLVFFSSRLGHYADARTLHDIRVRIIAKLGVLPLGWFRSSGSGMVKKVMTYDLEEMHQLIAHALGEMIGAAVAILAGFSYLLLIDYRMAMVTISVLLLMWISYRIAMRSVSTHMTRLIAAEGRISAASVAYADGITVVKTFGAAGDILARFDSAVKAHTNAMQAWVTETKYSSGLSRLLASEMGILAAIMIAGLWLVYHGGLNMVTLIPFLVIGVGLPTSIVPAIHGAQGLRKGKMSAAHIQSLLSEPEIPEPGLPLRPENYRIEFDKVSFSYDRDIPALKNISATCEPGTVTALVGPSGAGKTTLASLLPRFYEVSGGAIRIGGKDIRQLSSATLLSGMSLVFQDVILLHDTVTENIRIGRPQASDEQVRQAAVAAQIHHVIEQLPKGYNTILGGSTGGLSGGEKQRLTIARAILSAAPIVILDEATAALDPDSETAVQEAIGNLALGKTLIVIAHRLHTIQAVDQILVLNQGELVESGTHESLLGQQGLYFRMWAAQQKGGKAI